MIRTVTNYTFNVTAYNAYTLTLPDFTSLQPERLIRVYNLTQRITLYEVNPQEFISGNVAASGDVFTFNLGQAPQNNSDLIHIEYDDPSYDVPVSVVDGNQKVTTAGTSVQLVSSFTPCKTVMICALPSNSAANTIVVGGSDVVASISTRKGIPVSSSGTSININDASKLYLDTTASGDGVSWMVVA